MEIIINGVKQTVEENSTLQSIVVSQLGDKLKGVAVAVNNQVVPQSSWDVTSLNSNDSILIIKATQGG